MLIDSHCHLEFPEFAHDLDGIVARARAAGVARMVTIGTTMKGFPYILHIAEKYDDVFCAVGVHPHDSGNEGEHVGAADIVKAAQHPKIVGIGESGLDYFYDHSPRDEQRRNFRAHIRAALETKLPLIIHTRDAEDDTIQILKEETAGATLTGVLHCFSSARYLAEEALAMGLYISASGMITFKKSEEIRNTLRDVPLDRLLVETDAPFLAPVPFRGKMCEPAHVVYTARCLAEIKGVSEAEIAKVTTSNFFKLFPKVSKPEGCICA